MEAAEPELKGAVFKAKASAFVQFTCRVGRGNDLDTEGTQLRNRKKRAGAVDTRLVKGLAAPGASRYWPAALGADCKVQGPVQVMTTFLPTKAAARVGAGPTVSTAGSEVTAGRGPETTQV